MADSIFLAGAREISKDITASRSEKLRGNFSVLLLVIAPRSTGYAITDHSATQRYRYYKKQTNVNADLIFMAGARGIEPRS